MKNDRDSKAKRGMRIAGAIVLSLLGLALLPVLALPYDGLDWLIYTAAYREQQPVPTTEPTKAFPGIPCAELPLPGEPLVARVNGQRISLQAYERELNQLLDALAVAGEDLEGDEFQTQLPVVRRQILDLLIDNVLVQQAAVEAGITVTDDEIHQRMVEVVDEGRSLIAFQAWLEETGQSWEEFGRDMCQDILHQKMFDYVTEGISSTLDMVWARQVVVATPDEAVVVLTRLASGESFEDVAREVSLDEATRDRGGDLGWIPRGLGWIPIDMEEALFAGRPGQVQGPLEVEGGFVIVQTVEVQIDYALDPDTWEAVRATTFRFWLEGRREASEIVIFVDLEAERE
jgi:parvulin-like peptidyl-prolyl isomerase